RPTSVTKPDDEEEEDEPFPAEDDDDELEDDADEVVVPPPEVVPPTVALTAETMPVAGARSVVCESVRWALASATSACRTPAWFWAIVAAVAGACFTAML